MADSTVQVITRTKGGSRFTHIAPPTRNAFANVSKETQPHRAFMVTGWVVCSILSNIIITSAEHEGVIEERTIELKL